MDSDKSPPSEPKGNATLGLDISALLRLFTPKWVNLSNRSIDPFKDVRAFLCESKLDIFCGIPEIVNSRQGVAEGQSVFPRRRRNLLNYGYFICLEAR